MKFCRHRFTIGRSKYPHFATPSTLDFAEDFFNLSWEDVKKLPEDKLKALEELKDFFMDFSDEKLEELYKDGFGESLDEMFDKTADGSLVPKLARDYTEKVLGCLWEEFASVEGGGTPFMIEAYTEKYGEIW